MKKSMRYYIVLGLLSLLSACATDSETAQDVSNKVNETYYDAKDTAHLVARSAGIVAERNASEAVAHTYNLEQSIKANFYHNVDRIADWIRPDVPKPPQPVAASYCYSALQDILCYRAPMPGWEHRLIAYQGTGAPPPVPSTMKLLPVHVVDNTMLPETRAANAKPVFAKPPEELKTEKTEESTSVNTGAVDATHEQLPDPALAPQL